MAHVLTSGKIIPLYYGFLALGLFALLLLLRAVRRSSGLTLPGIELGGELDEGPQPRDVVALDAMALSTLACTEAPQFKRVLFAASPGFILAGLLGLILTRLPGEPMSSAPVAAVVAGAAAAGLAYWLAGVRTAEPVPECGDLDGLAGEVTISIPEDSYGQVALAVRGQRLTFGARSTDFSAIGRGSAVRVVGMVGHRVVVETAGPDR